MKAFSFSSILKNFGKQLSSLASQMPWCNLRFNLGSMSVLSRVSRPFSRTSFALSRRASRYAAMIFAVLVMSMANIGMAWGQTSIYASGYENGNGTWNTGGGMTVTSETTNYRTGTKAIKGSHTSSNSAKYATQETGTTTTNDISTYCHIIGWAKSANGTMKAYIGFNSSKKGSEVTLSTSNWTRISYVGNKINATTIILYRKGSGSDKYDVYFDDIVAYSSSSKDTDLAAPSSATSASASTTSVSWTNGSDTETGATGIQKTLIWKRTSGSADDLTLNDQGIYSLTSTEGPSTDQSGHWTLVSATVASDATSYDGTFSMGDRIAIVHRDMAYNYSTPTYVTVAGVGCAATIPGDITKGAASGGTGQITLTAEGSPVSGDTWYWQSAANGTATNLGSGATKNVSAAGTYYIRSYNSVGDCWSNAKSVTVAAADLLTPISLSLTYDHPTLVLTSITSATPTLTGNVGSGSVSYSSGTTATATVNGSTGVVSAVAAGTTVITVNVGASGNYAAGSTTATIKVVPAPAGLVDQKLATGDVAWDASVIVTSDQTNITGLTALSQHGSATASGNGNTSNGGQTSKIGTATGDFNASNYLELSFNVASGKRLNVSSVTIPVQPVTSSTNNFKAVLSDNQGSSNIEGATTNQTQGTLNNITFSSFGTLKGTVTLRIYAWGWSNGYRLGKNIIINGTIEDDVTPSCTAPDHVDISSSTGEFGFFGGETTTLTATAYDDSDAEIAAANITGYQWKRNGTTISGATSKTLTINNCTVSNAGDYSCVVSTGATCSTESSSYGTKVYVLQQYIGGETTYNFTRVGTSKVGTVNVTLAASTQREFKIYAGTMTSESYYMGNNGTIDEDASNWDFEGGKNNVKLNPGLGGTFTFTIDYTANGGAPKVSVAYPRKTIYLTPGVWNADGAKYAFYYFRDGGSNGWTDLLTNNDCGMSAEIPQWNGVKIDAVRLKNTCTSPNWDDKWNQTSDITISSNNSVVITNWGDGDSPYTYGTYSTPTYTISFNANEGTGTTASVTNIACGSNATLTANAFTRTGYTFAGWATSANGEKVYDDKATISNITSNITLYAKWTANTNTAYTVKHYKQQLDETYSATPDETQNLTGTTAASVTPAVKSYEGFTAPSTQTVTIAADGSTVVTYQYTRNSYTLTWDVNSGNALTGDYTTGMVAYGTTIAKPADPTREGYTFAGWSPAVAATMPANDVTYTAQWTENAQTYTITYNLGQENWKGENPLPTYTAGTVHTLPTIDNLTNDNYGTFYGWYESADFQGDAVTTIPADATGDKTYYAKWVYDIKFFEVVDETTDVQNKEFKKQLTGASYPTTYTYGIGITLPDLPAKDGYTADGWYSQWCVYHEEENGLSWVDACKSTALDNNAYGNVNFAVKYTANKYTITWNANGGNVSPASSTYTYGGSTVALPTPTRDGYTFNGWFTADTEGTKITEIGTTNKPTSDVTYYAQWTENTPVTPPTQGGEVTAMWPMVDGSDVSLVGNATHASITLSDASKNGDLITIEGTQQATYTDYTERMAIVKVSSNLNDKNESINANNYIKYTLTVAQGYTFTPTGFSAKIGRQGTDNGSAQVVLKKGNTTLGSTDISQPSRHSAQTTVPISIFEGTINNASACVASETIDLYVYFGGKMGGKNFLISEVNIYGTYAPTTDEPEPDNCGISECGNATLTYTINASTNTTNTADNLLSSATASNTAALGVNDKAVFSNITASEAGKAAAATNECFNPAPVMSSKITMHKGSSYNANTYLQFTFTVKSGYTFTPCDVQFIVQPVMTDANFRWVITNGTTEYGSGTVNDVPVGQNNGATALLGLSSTSAMPAGTYYIRLYPYDNDGDNDNSFRISNDVILKGTIEEVVCTTPDAPTAFAVGSITSNGATFTITDAANTNNYEIYYSTTSTAPTAETEATITTTEKTKAVTGLTAETTYYAWVRAVCNEENKSSWVALTNNSFTTSAELTPGDCVTIFEAKATSKTAFSATTGTITSSNLSEGDELNIDGYKFAVKPNSSNALKIAPKAGETFKVGDKLTFVVYTAKDKEIGFVIGGNTYTQSVNKSLYYFEQELKETDITDGATTITFNRNSGDARWVEVKIERCAQLPSCTTPVLSDLENKKVCPGEAVSWTAIVNNTASLQDGEMIAYQWNKKGNNTVLSNNATLTLENVTEAAGGTYVVTATVSADGKASKTASKEVTLTVTPATATPTITASASTIFAGNDVTLTASCVSSGVSYKWYTCNANGTNEQAIDGATNATYTLTEEEAGTYYYKVIVTGNGTNSCGDAEKVYTLVVSNSGETTCGEIKGQFTTGAYTFDTDFIIYGINSGGNLDEGASSSQGTRCGGSGNYFGKQRFVVTFPVDVLSFSFIGYQSNLRTVKAVKTTTDLKTADTEYTTITHTAEVSQEGNCQTHVITPETAIPANTFVWVELSNRLNISEICYVPVSTADCTDPQVTATVDNATVCEGTENVTFTATNYADGTTTFQWQKKDGNTWTNINGAISATYTISSVTTAHAGQYRVIAEKGCKRMSEEVKLTVLTAPTFNTFATTASVMKGNALAISDVQATGATGYAWYKSADNSLDAAEDTKVGTSKDLLLAAASIPEAADQTFYLFCVASNSCGSVTSNAITVTVTPFVEEECATKGNEGDREFGFKNTSCGQDTYGDSKTPVWKTSSRSKYLTYTAPEGRYFATAKVTVAHTGGTKCGYAYSTDGGTTWEVEELDGLSTTLTAITIELPANVNAFRISRNLTAQDGEKGSDTGIFYLAEACFTYENACTETTLTAGSYNNEYNISTQMDFVEPTFTLKAGETALEGQTLTYTSSNTAIATVDEDGNVTFEGITGTVTITATFAGGEINETEYCACQGSYTITVGCKDQAPKIVAAAGTNLNGCNNSITLEAKMQDGTTAFADGTFQWYRDGEAIEGATSASYIVVRAGTYTVSRTYTCTTMSSNSAVVTNENVEPQVERLTPFQYYHVDKTYSNQMKGRHLFAVTSYGTLNGKRYHLTATRNGETLDLSSSTAFFTIPSSDNAVDTVMIDLNELKGKYSANDEIVITCAPINSCNNASAITASITIHVIDQTPTLALICSGAKADGTGTRVTAELTVGGDFLTGYNPADLCQQTSNTTFDPNTEWGFYTELKEKYIVTPVNGYAEFNKLNYEPFDILLLTDYPKTSKSEAAATILDDMAALCDYRPLLSLKAHMVAKSPSKWAAKGFTTSPVVPATTSQYANIVCYAHPMFDDLDDAHVEGIYHDHDDFNQLVYQILTGPGHEGSKGLQGFELKDADNFVTIGLIHYNATAEVVTHIEGGDTHTHLEWTPAADDRQLVAIAERQANIEARMILFAINCGAQSMQTPMGRQVLLTCLDYLLKTDLIEVADCRLTFDNGEGATNNAKWENGEKPHDYQGTGYQGDGLWSTAANWGPEYTVVPGRNNDVRIAAPCTVDANEVEVLSVHITENGSLTIPADKSFTARSTILRADENGNVYPTNVEDISLGSNAGGNASLILNNERGDTKAGVAMYSTATADTKGYSAAESTWQYIGTPHSDVQNAAKNYYDSWLYQYDTGTQGWAVIPNGGPLDPFRGYCITHPKSPHTYWMEGTLVSTTNQDISIPANRFVVVANSWTAPIQINELTDDDMEGLRENTIYFFNTGSDPNQAEELNKENGRYAAGTYVSVPIHSAPYTGDSYIPSMQGFYVVGGGADGTLHLDYERHVRAPRKNTPSGPMHAPARRVAADNEPQVAKFLFRGTRYDDRLIILERPDFTRGYDSGWDGEQWGGNAAAPMSYVVTETRWDAVSAIPEYEGTVIAFRAGEDSEYTIHFDYDGMEDALYLLDTDTQIYTRVLKGNSYTFTCTDKAEHNRFILTRKAPQIATGTDHINTGENAKAVKFIKDDKIFIFVNGMLYDATGKMVIR